MSCNRFKKYEVGKISSAKFERHAKECAICREKIGQDGRLMSMAKSLQEKPIHAPQLWGRIEESLNKEREKEKEKMGERPQSEGDMSVTGGIRGRAFRFKFFPLLPAAAAILVAAGFGIYFGFRALSTPPSSGLLERQALAKIEKIEREHMKAIEELEKKALPRMASLDQEMMLLYRDKLETINSQIERCQEALASNPANAHIRRYLLAALQDKKGTLAELLSYKPEKSI
jgi:hypothetical protein